MMITLDELVISMEEKGILKSPLIKRAFLTVDRIHFVAPEQIDRAYLDIALPIIEGQTISQPRTVAFMLELLQPQPGDTVLDVGAGSCYTTALLANIVGLEGKVFAIERLKALKEFGENNLRKVPHQNIQLIADNGAKGWPEHAPFDRILVNAAAPSVPEALKKQLKVGGSLVIPLANLYGHVALIKRVAEDEFQETRYPGFSFVPFIDD